MMGRSAEVKLVYAQSVIAVYNLQHVNDWIVPVLATRKSLFCPCRRLHSCFPDVAGARRQ